MLQAKAEVIKSDCRERTRRQEKKRRVNLAWRWRRQLAGMGMDLKERFVVGRTVFELVVGYVSVHRYGEIRLTIQMKISFSEKGIGTSLPGEGLANGDLSKACRDDLWDRHQGIKVQVLAQTGLKVH